MFLCSGSTFKFSEEIVFPFNLIDPFLIFCSPAMVLKIVVFPIPDGPSKHIISPSFSMEKDTFLTFVLPPTTKSTLFTSKKLLLFIFP